jgi:hypothetical protein
VSNGHINPFGSVIGREIASITFVRDYVQIGFDGPVLTAVTWPELSATARLWTTETSGYRDVLCSTIGRRVTSAGVTDLEIFIEVEDGVRMVVSLSPEDRTGSESAHFDDDAGEHWVWGDYQPE